jgi:hypothetical protein
MEKGGWGRTKIWEFAMNKQNLLLRGADNVLPSPRGDDEFFDVLGPALEEVAGLQRDESPHQGTNDLVLLLEENARLRKLAVSYRTSSETSLPSHSRRHRQVGR